VKQVAKAAVTEDVEASLRRLCARWLLERAALKALGAEVPEVGAGLDQLVLAVEVPPNLTPRGRLPRTGTVPLQSPRRALRQQLARDLFA